VAKTLVRPALWFCACNLLAAALAAQCSNPTQVPNGTYTSGDHSATDNNALSAANFVLSGSATATFVAGNCIDLQPGFHATAGTAGTTFHACVETAPADVSVSPPSGSGLSQAFTWTVSSPSGYGNLSDVFALFNTSVFFGNACYIHYNRTSNLLYLADNTGAYWIGGFVPGGSSSAGNASCTIYGTGSSVSASGNQLTLTVSVTFQPSFSGVKNEYLIAYDNEGLNSTWQQMETWTVPASQQYYLTTAVSPSGGGTISPASGWYNSGSPVTITATPTSGYHFNGFTGSVNSGSNPLTVTMNGAMTETANFTQTVSQYQLTTGVSPSGGGTMSPSCPGGCMYNSGSQVAIAATAASGYQFNGFTGSVNSGSNPLTVTVNGAVAETANFTPTVTQYQLTTGVSPSGGGTVGPSCPGGCMYNSGSQVTITATPASGYQFGGFTGVDSSNGSVGYVTMNANRSVTANFTAPGPTITGISPTSGAIGSNVTITGTGFGASGTVSFNGTQAPIVSWSATSIAAQVPVNATTGTITVSTGGYQAGYYQQQFQVTAVGVTVSPASATLGQGQTQQFIATVTGTSNQQVSWSLSGAGSVSSTGLYTAPATISNGQILTVTATSAALPTASGIALISLTPPAPSISSLSLPQGPPQMGFVISGANFGSAQGGVTLTGLPGGDRQLQVINWNSTDRNICGTLTPPCITVQVQASTPLGAGEVYLVTSGGLSNQVPFTVTGAFNCSFQ
jgi:hypothetical protein